MTTYRLDIEVNTEDAVPAHQTAGQKVAEWTAERDRLVKEAVAAGMTESEIARTEIRKGDVIRFRPRARRNTVTVSVTHGFDGYGWILGYRAKIEGDVVISRGMEPLAYAVPETVELVRR